MAPSRSSMSVPARSLRRGFNPPKRGGFVKKSGADLFLEATDILAVIMEPFKPGKVSKTTRNETPKLKNLPPLKLEIIEKRLCLTAVEKGLRNALGFEEFFEQFLGEAGSASLDEDDTRTPESTTETTPMTTAEATSQKTIAGISGTTPENHPGADLNFTNFTHKVKPFPYSITPEDLVQVDGWTVASTSEVRNNPTLSIPTSFLLTTPNGETFRKAFRDCDKAGKLMLKFNANDHDIDGIGDTHHYGSQFRVLIVCNQVDLKVINRDIVKAEHHLCDAILNKMFPNSYEGQKIEWRILHKSPVVDSMGKETEYSRIRAIVDYSLDYGDEDPEVVIVSIEMVRKVVLARIYQDEYLRKRTNLYIERRENKTSKGGRPEKRAWANDDDEGYGEKIRRKRHKGDADEDGGMKSLSDDKNWEEWLNKPRIIIHGMDDFNIEALEGLD